MLLVLLDLGLGCGRWTAGLGGWMRGAEVGVLVLRGQARGGEWCVHFFEVIVVLIVGGVENTSVYLYSRLGE